MKTITYSIYYPDVETKPFEYQQIVNRANKSLSKIFQFNRKLKLLEISEEPYLGPNKLISEIRVEKGVGYEIRTSAAYVASILKIVYQTDGEKI